LSGRHARPGAISAVEWTQIVATIHELYGRFIPGVCRYCGCTEDNACLTAGERLCGWLDLERTVCDAPPCVARFGGEGGLEG
jgi:hypothetical protein